MNCFVIILAIGLFLPVVRPIVLNVNGVVVGPVVVGSHGVTSPIIVPFTPHLAVIQCPKPSMVSYIVSP